MGEIKIWERIDKVIKEAEELGKEAEQVKPEQHRFRHAKIMIPSFWQVYEEVKSKISPSVDRLLRNTYEELKTEKKMPSFMEVYLKIKDKISPSDDRLLRDTYERLKVIKEDKDEEDRKGKKIYIPPTVMPKQKQQLVDSLIEIQRKIKELEAQLNQYKTEKGKLEEPILKYLEQVKADGIRLEKILIFIQKSTSVPSFWQVYEAVKSELTPKIDKLLRETYEKLQIAKEPHLTIRLESISEAGWWESLKQWFKSKFEPLLNAFSQGLDKIESLLGLKGGEPTPELATEKVNEEVKKGAKVDILRKPPFSDAKFDHAFIFNERLGGVMGTTKDGVEFTLTDFDTGELIQFSKEKKIPVEFASPVFDKVGGKERKRVSAEEAEKVYKAYLDTEEAKQYKRLIGEEE